MPQIDDIYKIQNKIQNTEERLIYLKKILNYLKTYEESICQAIFRDFHKHPIESSLTEILPCISECKFAIQNLNQWTREKKVSTPITLLGTQNKIRYEPKGLSLIISPWNYPLQLSIAPIIACISAGNTFVLKVSEHSPHSSQMLAKMIEEIFPPNIAICIQGDSQVAAQLLKHKFNHIFFTGSTAVGKLVMQAAAQNLTPVTLELGGKSPCIVDETCDIKRTAEKIFWGKSVNAGQTCVAPDYIWIHESRLSEFLVQIKQVQTQFYNNKETSADSDYAAIINEKNFLRLQDFINNASTELSVKQVTPEEKQNRKIALRIIVNPKLDSKIMQEEIFGPILPILTYKTLDEIFGAINKQASLQNPLALYIFSNNLINTEIILKNISSGGVCINECLIHLANHNFGFGGIGSSGIGQYHGYQGFLEFSHSRSVLVQNKKFGFYGFLGLEALKTFYPPYRSIQKKILGLLYRL